MSTKFVKTKQGIESYHGDLFKHLKHQWQLKSIDKLKEKLDQLNQEMSQPNFWNNPRIARKTGQEKSDIEKIIEPWEKLQIKLEEFPILMDISWETMTAEEALSSLEKDILQLDQEFEDLLMISALTNPDDWRNAILTITPGAGGTESQDWAEMLLRMYQRWCEKRKFPVKLLDFQVGEEAGIKSACLLIQSKNAYGLLKSENGIHRLVRISPFDANKKRHTSFAAVHVSPEIDDDVEIEIDDKDLRVDTYRASGAGGQHVNKTDSAIRITHLPSKIVIQCQSERSQYSNRKQAMKMLRARLYEFEKQKIQESKDMRAGEKLEVAWGNQIRSYVLHPYKMIKDLRTNYETSNTEEVLNGNIDALINSYLQGLKSSQYVEANE